MVRPEQTVQADSASVSYQPKPVPYARLETVGLPEKNQQDLRVKLTYPQASQDFRTQAFAINPKITALTTAEVVSGKAVLIRGHSLTLTGTNFDPVAANHSVRFTLANNTVVNATPTAASATSLTVTVPNTVDVAGDVGVQVVTGLRTTSSATGMVPIVNLNVSNGGFH